MKDSINSLNKLNKKYKLSINNDKYNIKYSNNDNNSNKYKYKENNDISKNNFNNNKNKNKNIEPSNLNLNNQDQSLIDNLSIIMSNSSITKLNNISTNINNNKLFNFNNKKLTNNNSSFLKTSPNKSNLLNKNKKSNTFKSISYVLDKLKVNDSKIENSIDSCKLKISKNNKHLTNSYFNNKKDLNNQVLLNEYASLSYNNKINFTPISNCNLNKLSINKHNQFKKSDNSYNCNNYKSKNISFSSKLNDKININKKIYKLSNYLKTESTKNSINNNKNMINSFKFNKNLFENNKYNSININKNSQNNIDINNKNSNKLNKQGSITLSIINLENNSSEYFNNNNNNNIEYMLKNNNLEVHDYTANNITLSAKNKLNKFKYCEISPLKNSNINNSSLIYNSKSFILKNLNNLKNKNKLEYIKCNSSYYNNSKDINNIKRKISNQEFINKNCVSSKNVIFNRERSSYVNPNTIYKIISDAHLINQNELKQPYTNKNKINKKHSYNLKNVISNKFTNFFSSDYNINNNNNNVSTISNKSNKNKYTECNIQKTTLNKQKILFKDKIQKKSSLSIKKTNNLNLSNYNLTNTTINNLSCIKNTNNTLNNSSNLYNKKLNYYNINNNNNTNNNNYNNNNLNNTTLININNNLNYNNLNNISNNFCNNTSINTASFNPNISDIIASKNRKSSKAIPNDLALLYQNNISNIVNNNNNLYNSNINSITNINLNTNINNTILTNNTFIKGNIEILQLENYKIVATIGIGSTAKIKLIQEKTNNSVLAVKIINYSKSIKANQHDKIINELDILKEVDHPFIIKLVSFNITSSHIFFGMQYVQGGDLFSHLRFQGTLSINEAKFYISQIICALCYLHDLNIIYRDLKPENILITNSGYLKLIDFSISKPCRGKTYTFCGTPEYCSPEIALNQGHTYSCDLWSLGILTYELIVGITPFGMYSDDPFLIYNNISKGKYKFPVDINKEAKEFISMLLISDPSKRLGVGKNQGYALANNSFFKNYDWVSLEKQTMNAYYIPKIKNNTDTSNFAHYCDDSYEELLDYVFNEEN